MKNPTRLKLIILLLIILFGNLVIGLYIYKSNQKLNNSELWVQHSIEVVKQSDKISATDNSIKIAAHAFIISNDSAFLKPVYDGKKTITTNIALLKNLTKDNPLQQKRLDSLSFYIAKRLDFSFQMIELGKIQGLENTMSGMLIREDKLLSAHIEQIIKSIQQEEAALYMQREKTYLHSITMLSQLSIVLFVLIFLVTILFLIVSGKYFLQRKEKEKRADELVIANKERIFQNTERERRAAELAIANEELLFQNREKENRTDELAVANTELLFQNHEKEKRAAELVIANKELLFQNKEKENRADELVIAHKELIKEEEQKEFDRNNLKALINNTNDLMWSIDRDYKLITSNEPFNEKILLKSGVAIYSSEKTNAYNKLYERAFAGETFTETNYTPIPYESWSEISFHPIFKGDEVIGTACHSRDITQRKNTELKVEEQNVMLLKTNSELDRFVYSVSHDLRSPLTSILGLISLIDSESKEINTLEYTRMIKISVRRLDRFIKNILNYSRNNRTDIEPERIHLKKAVTEIVMILQNMKEAKDIDFEINLDEQYPFYTDYQRFNTILENLITNAIKYHNKESSGRHIKITGKSDKDKLHLTVADNGIGIIPEYHEKIFEMFFRIPGEAAGSGIGLYIVKEIIERLEGSIEINSVEGAGTSFTIILKNLK